VGGACDTRTAFEKVDTKQALLKIPFLKPL
jgi:hypothetical protein